MRKTLFLLFACGCWTAALAQRVYTPLDFKPGEVIDRVQYRIVYDLRYVQDISQQPYDYWEEQMLLEVGRQVTAYYSYTVYQADSINAAAYQRGETNFVGAGTITQRLYRNYPKAGQCTVTDGFSLERYACTEPLDAQQWTLVADSTADIMGYACRLATAQYKGRTWSAWYTDDLPLSEGPWKLCGLPGLVLRAYDAERQYVFEVSGMTQVGGRLNMEYRGEGYETVSRKTLDKIYRRYYADPVGYITASGNVRIIQTDENGNEMDRRGKASPYNPIER